MAKKKKVVFNKLKKLTVSQRLKEVQESPVGSTMLSALTPTQLAELFPKYYQQGLPDVGGFREAISQKTQKQQEAWREKVNDAAGLLEPSTPGEGGATKFNVGKGGFSHAQAAALALKAGATPEEAKILGALVRQESSGNPNAHNYNPDTGDNSYGLWQINMLGKLEGERLKKYGLKSKEDLFDPMTNARVALQILRGANGVPTDWGAYRDLKKNGTWEQALAAAEPGASGRVPIPSAMPEQTASVIGTVQTSGNVGEHFGESHQCVALSKHFAPQIGPAAGWKVGDSSGIVPGAVIATRSYNDGSGGHMAKDMPDHASHYHTGIALTKPDANGNVLILDQAVGHGSRITKVNVNDYNGEKWGLVSGGEPTERSMSAVRLALSRANDSEKSAIETSMKGAQPATVVAKEIKPVVESQTQAPSKPVTQENKPSVTTPQLTEKTQGAVVTETAKVEAPKQVTAPAPLTFKFDEAAFLKEVRAKNMGASLVSDEYIMGETLKGFANTPGVKYDRKSGTITITDPNSPAIQQIKQDMKNNNLDDSLFLHKVERKAEAAPRPEVRQTEGPKLAATHVSVPEQAKHIHQTINNIVAQAETTKKKEEPRRGEVNKPAQAVKIASQERTGPTPAQNKPTVDVNKKPEVAKKPESKETTMAMSAPNEKKKDIAAPPDKIKGELDNIRQEMNSSLSQLKQPVENKKSQVASTELPDDNPNAIGKIHDDANKVFLSPSMKRAMYRTAGVETGDATDGFKHSRGTNGISA